MTRNLSRLLYALSALIFGFGGVMHALAFVRKALPTIAASNLAPFFQAELKTLWLCDSTTLVALAVLFGYLSVKPCAMSRTLVWLVALVPAGTTLLLYTFLGPFYAGHLLLAATVMAVLASALSPETDRSLAVAAP